MRKNKTTDDVVGEVRRARAEVAKERAKNPRKFHEKTRRLIYEFGMRKSRLKPIKLEFSRRNKKIDDAA